MRTTSPFKSNIRRRPKVSLFVTLFIVVMVAISNLIWPSVFANIIYTIAVPVVRTNSWLDESLSALGTYFASKNYLVAENTLLKTELQNIREQSVMAKSLQDEIIFLKSLLGRTDDKVRVFAGVLSRPPLSPYDRLVIDAGVQEGIAVGDYVYSTGGSVIGKISEVFKDFARVTLFSSPGLEIPVSIGNDHIPATAIGTGGGSFSVLLPRESSVAIGDAVFFPDIPPPLLGVVGSIESQQVDFLQLVSFHSLVNIYELQFVSVGLSIGRLPVSHASSTQ